MDREGIEQAAHFEQFADMADYIAQRQASLTPLGLIGCDQKNAKGSARQIRDRAEINQDRSLARGNQIAQPRHDVTGARAVDSSPESHDADHSTVGLLDTQGGIAHKELLLSETYRFVITVRLRPPTRSYSS